MDNVYPFGAKASEDDGPTPDDQTDHDLGRPEFVAYSVRKEARVLLASVAANWPDDDDLIASVDRLYELAVSVDDRISAKE